MKKRGRPKSQTDVRDGRIVFYLTEEDAEQLNKDAVKLGFKSRSEFCTAIMERLLIGRFAPMVFLKVGLQLGARADKRGLRKGTGYYFGIRPLPPLPDEEIPVEEYKPIVEAVEKEMKKSRETKLEGE